MQKWKPTVVTYILVVASSFGVFTIFGTEMALGTIVGGNISIDTTWNLGGSPYIVMENVIVDPGVTLTIDPGVQVKFDPPGQPPGFHDLLSIFIEGNLVSIGQSGNPVVFTSNSGSPAYDWMAVQINSTGFAEIRNCSVSYGEGIILASAFQHNITNISFNQASVRTLTPGHFVGHSTFTNYSYVALDSSNNTVFMNDMDDGSILVHSPSNFILNNFMMGMGPPSWMIDVDSSNNTIGDNMIIDDGDDTGIDIYGENNTVRGNTVIGTRLGIYIHKDNNTVSRNEVLGPGQRGISITSGFNNRIEHNTIQDYQWGIRIFACPAQNVVTGNRIQTNSLYGIYTQNSWNNLIYHNLVADNQIQAYDDTGGNLWDNGYPIGGNYWSNYTGTDQYSGPSQTILGADGLGDTPYLLDVGSADRYPLMDSLVGNLPPRNLDASLGGASFENVTMSWNLSWNDGHRANDTTGYEVFRSSIYDKGRGGYAIVATLPNRTKEFTDVSAGNGNPDNFFYYVCAINGTGNSSCTVDQVGKFTRNLTKGWNLASFPLIVNHTLLRDSLRTTTVLGIRQYDAGNPQNPWREYFSLKPYEEFIYVNTSMSYWLNIESDSAMVIAGRVPTSVDISLKSGWNLVGYPSFSGQSIIASFLGLPLEEIEGFDGSSPPYLLQDLQLTDTLKEGEGYWIKVSSDCNWHVDN